MFGILKFQTFLLVVLLFICSCTYLHNIFPAWLDRNKSGHLLESSEDRRAVEPLREPMLHSYGSELIDGTVRPSLARSPSCEIFSDELRRWFPEAIESNERQTDEKVPAASKAVLQACCTLYPAKKPAAHGGDVVKDHAKEIG